MKYIIHIFVMLVVTAFFIPLINGVFLLQDHKFWFTSGFITLLVVYCFVVTYLSILLENEILHRNIKRGDVVYYPSLTHNETYWLVKNVINDNVTVMNCVGHELETHKKNLIKIKNG